MELKRVYDKSGKGIGRRLTTEERNEERLKSIYDWHRRWDSWVRTTTTSIKTLGGEKALRCSQAVSLRRWQIAEIIF